MVAGALFVGTLLQGCDGCRRAAPGGGTGGSNLPPSSVSGSPLKPNPVSDLLFDFSHIPRGSAGLSTQTVAAAKVVWQAVKTVAKDTVAEAPWLHVDAHWTPPSAGMPVDQTLPAQIRQITFPALPGRKQFLREKVVSSQLIEKFGINETGLRATYSLGGHKVEVCVFDGPAARQARILQRVHEHTMVVQPAASSPVARSVTRVYFTSLDPPEAGLVWTHAELTYLVTAENIVDAKGLLWGLAASTGTIAKPTDEERRRHAHRGIFDLFD